MKNLYLFLSLVFILSSDIKASGIQFVTSFEKAKELAKSQEKVIFVDVMADWCMPCKAMIQDINKNKEVYDFFNTHFINVQINEKYQRSFLTKYNVTAFPTLFFLSSSGDVLQSLVGYGGISLLYEQAQIHYNNNKIYKSIDIVDTDEFDEESFYNTLLGQYLSMPQSIKFKKSADYLDKG
ncbi:MAG TPA: thioredoxin domain-containing protein, partial [Saprospiraceae bacterium]|nr:thioredoxin domain-containing protein [Saprospiraceae bacterium]